MPIQARIPAFAIALLFGSCLSGCSSWTPYDYDDPYNEKREQADSCREDPYQDQCQPGGM